MIIIIKIIIMIIFYSYCAFSIKYSDVHIMRINTKIQGTQARSSNFHTTSRPETESEVIL